MAVRVELVDPAAKQRRDRRVDEDLLKSPGSEVLRLVSMEHAPAWAEVLWLQVVQELGRPIEGAEPSYDRLQRWSNIAVDLDPRYFTIYHATASQLIAYARRGHAADEILLKGRKALPDRWEFPFLLGYVAYFLHGNAASAAEYWEDAAHFPDAPRFFPSLAGRARYHSGDQEGAIVMLESMLDILEGPHREDALTRIKLFRSEPRLVLYDAACERFRSEQGRAPRDGAELHDKGYVSDPPYDLLDEPITLDDRCRARTKFFLYREDEAMLRVGSQAPGADSPEPEYNEMKVEESSP